MEKKEVVIFPDGGDWSEHRALIAWEMTRLHTLTERMENSMRQTREELIEVTSEIKNLQKSVENFLAVHNVMDGRVNKIEKDLVELQTKATIYGGMAGTVISAIWQLIYYFITS